MAVLVGKNSIIRITQNRPIVLFSWCFFNKSEVRKKCRTKCHSIIKLKNISSMWILEIIQIAVFSVMLKLLKHFVFFKHSGILFQIAGPM